MRGTRDVIGMAILTAVLAVDVQGQQVQAAMSVAGGTATDVAGVGSRAITASPSLAIALDPRLLLSANASATRYDNRQWAVGGGVASSMRAPLGRHAALTLDAGATGTQTSYDFSYAIGRAIPAAELALGPISAYGGLQAALASTAALHPVTTPAGLLGGSPFASRSTTSGRTTTRRTARGSIFGTNARFASDAGETMLIGIRDERSTIETATTVDRSISMSVWRGVVRVGGVFGRHNEVGAATTFGNGVVSCAVSSVATLELSGGTYATNRLVGTPGGQFVNIGVSLGTGRASSNGTQIAGLPAPAAGVTRLVLRALEATNVDVAGDFTNWKFIAAHRAAQGVWVVDLRIPPGQYRYAFRVDGTTWRVPDGSAVVDDDFGGKSAWLIVSAPGDAVR
jgi:hypothetical protein